MVDKHITDRDKLGQSIAALEAQRAILGDEVVDTMIAAAREKLASLEPDQLSDHQRKQVTILFADVVGSTAMGEKLDPEDVMNIMDGGLRSFGEAVQEHKGVVGRFMGDGMLAFFGVPAAREDDPERAIRTGLAILAAAKVYGQSVEEIWGIDNFAVRVGINTGMVVMGEVGAGNMSDYTAMGDAVNLAARLESAAPPGGLLIGHDTYRHVRGLFDMKTLEPITVKGKTDPVQVYLVRQARSRAFRKPTRGVEGIETRMIGREAELKRLQDTFNTVIEEKEHRIVTIVGDAGIGKSRLLVEFDSWLGLQSKNLNFFKGRAGLEMQNSPYALIRDLFSFRFQIRDSDRSNTVRTKMEQGISEALGAERGQMKAHFIGHLLGFDFSNSPHLKHVLENAKQIHNRALLYMTQYSRAIATQHPVLILVDDIHWADDASLDVLNRVSSAMPDQSLLIVCATRPSLFERWPHWGEAQEPSTRSGQTSQSRLDLAPLSKRDSDHLVNALLQKAEQVPEALRELVVSGTEGNPFYIEELLKMLIEDGAIIKGESFWQIEPNRLTTIRIPPTLTGILQARLDRLSDEERVILQQASVVGRRFWDAVVERISETSGQEIGEDTLTTKPIDELDRALSTLRGKEMVFQQETSAFTGTQEYIFKHAILREVTYESVLKRLRRIYHALVAQWLIEHSSDRAGEVIGLIADHLESAGEAERAVGYLRQAGEEAAARFANKEAIGYFGRALALTPTNNPAERISLLLAREAVNDVLGDREAQVQDLAECERLATSLADIERLPTQAEVAMRQARYAEAISDFPAAISAAKMTIALARKAGAIQLEAAGCLHWGRALWKQGDYEAARIRLEQALSLAQSAKARPEEAGSLLNLGNVSALQSDFDQARVHYEQALPIYRELGHKEGEGATLGNMGNTYGYQGHAEQAIFNYEQALAIARDVGDRHDEGTWLGNLAIDYQNLGQLERALTYCGQALTIAQEIGDRRNQVIWLNILGSIYRTLGYPSRATEFNQRALTMARQIGSRQGEHRAITSQGHIACSQGAYAKAKEYFERSLAIGRELGTPEGEGSALHGLGDTWLGLGYADKATNAFQEAVDLWQASELPHLVIEAHAGLARAHLEKGEPKRALVHVEAILDHLTTHGLEETDDPFRIYFTCYQVLGANLDPRAQDTLTTAHNLLQTWAAKIGDEDLRRSFLQNVSSHREIVSEFAKVA